MSESLRRIHHPQIAEIKVLPTAEETAVAAADIICDVARGKREAVITYATGKTMEPVLEEVVRRSHNDGVDFSGTMAFHLDEYWPCSPNEPWSFVKFLRERAFEPLGIGRRFELNGMVKDPQAEAVRYNALLHDHPTYLAILGIGPDGHIGFNEVNTPFDSETHLAQLSEGTVGRDRERGQDSPDKALTQGIANICGARRIILVAYGEEKGKWLNTALYGEIGPRCPASALRMVGDKVTIVIDKEAAEQLSGYHENLSPQAGPFAEAAANARLAIDAGIMTADQGLQLTEIAYRDSMLTQLLGFPVETDSIQLPRGL